MYGLTWLIGAGLVGVVAGLAGGWFLAAARGRAGARIAELEEALAKAERQLDDYRAQVLAEFSDTARKFQTLNDAYTDLHQQLARSSSVLCGDVSGPLLAAPAGHQDLLAAELREESADAAPEDEEPAPNPGADPDEETPEASSPDPAEARTDPATDPAAKPAGEEDARAQRSL